METWQDVVQLDPHHQLVISYVSERGVAIVNKEAISLHQVLFKLVLAHSCLAILRDAI